jgi:hypothetical protein
MLSAGRPISPALIFAKYAIIVGISTANSATAGVVAYYPLDDNTYDATAFHRDGFQINGTYSTDVPAAIGSGKSIYFDNNSSVGKYMQIPNESFPDAALGDSFTLTLWAKIPAGTTGNRVLFSNSHFAYGITIYVEADYQRLKICTKSEDLTVAYANTGNSSFSLGSWHHVAIVRNGANATIYIDGANQTSASAVRSDFQLATRFFRIGASVAASGPGAMDYGYIDDVAIWNEAASPTVIASLANGSSSPADYEEIQQTKETSEVVAYYTFDDNVQDSTVNHFNGAAVNMNYSTDVPAQVGSGKSASWIDESMYRYVDLPIVRGMGPKFTVTCWLKTGNARSGWLPVLANGVPQNTHMILAVNSWGTSDKRIHMNTRDEALNADSASSDNNAFTLNTWQHVAWVRDGTNVTVYVNGTAASMRDSAILNDIPINLALRVGHNKQATYNNWGGLIDDLAIWDGALLPSTISNLTLGAISPGQYMVRPYSAVAHYTFDNIVGTTVPDASGRGYNGTLTALSISTNTASGSGSSLYWQDSGTARYVAIPEIEELDSRFTISMWVKIPTNFVNTSGGRMLIGNASTVGDGFNVYVNHWGSDLRDIWMISNNDSGSAKHARTATNTLSKGVWHHLAITRDNDAVTFYIDGVATNYFNKNYQMVRSDFALNKGLRIGANFNGGNAYCWIGNIDDVSLWRGVLRPNIIANMATRHDSPSNHYPAAYPGLSVSLSEGTPSLKWNGASYHRIGVNVPFITASFASTHNEGNYRAYKDVFEELRREKMPFIRCFLGGQSRGPYGFLYNTDKSLYFRELDKRVAEAERNGIGIIPALIRWADIADICQEHMDQWGVDNSATMAYMRTYVKDLISHYRGSPSFYAWEFCNELTNIADLPNHGGTPDCNPLLGTPATRASTDWMTRTIMYNMYDEFTKAVRLYDKHRMTSIGGSIPRADAWHNTYAGSWESDTKTQNELILIDDNQFMDSICCHVYTGRDNLYFADTTPKYTLSQLLTWMNTTANNVGQIFYLGEFGIKSDMSAQDQRIWMDIYWDTIIQQGIPLATYWSYECSATPTMEIMPGKALDWILEEIRTVNSAISP